MHAYLYDQGIDLVPIWSPEVSFLTDRTVSASDARQRLVRAGIRLVVLNADLNGNYLTTNVPFFRDDRQNWEALVTDNSTFALYELPDFGKP